MDSYGYIEVVGLVPAIAAADAALKAANVEVVGRENTGKAMIAVIIKGEIGAVRAAIDAAEAEVELRLQVFSTFFSPVLFISSTRFSSSGATYGPFLIDLLIFLCLPYLTLRRLTMNLSVGFFFLRVL